MQLARGIGGQQYGKRHDAVAEIRTVGAAELAGIARQVEHVVGDLERYAEPPRIATHRRTLRRLGTSDQCAERRRELEERGGLLLHDPETCLRGHHDEGYGQLAYLTAARGEQCAADRAAGGASERRDELVREMGQRRARFGSDADAVLAVQGRYASSRIAAVDDVIVDQGAQVRELDRRCGTDEHGVFGRARTRRRRIRRPPQQPGA